MNELIDILLKIEGLQDEGLFYKVEGNSTIFDAILYIIETRQENYDLIKRVFLNEKENEAKIFIVLLNQAIIKRQEFKCYQLNDNDELTLILTVAGG